MNDRRVLWGLCVACVVWATSQAAPAGPVRFERGEVTLTTTDAPSADFPLSFPSSGGHSARADSAYAGETRVLYDLRETAGGATFEVSQDNSGDTESSFAVTFTTDREMYYRFFAGPQPYAFSARFNGLVADAYYNPRGEHLSDVYRGSLVRINPLTERPDGFEARTFEGVLPRGTHSLTVESSGGVDRETVLDGGGDVRLTLESATRAIPLPPAAVPGALALAALGVTCACASKRRRPARRQPPVSL